MRYFLDTDQSSHWYLVPVEKQDEWQTWQELDGDDEASWDPPAWAISVNGSPTRVTFDNPEIE